MTEQLDLLAAHERDVALARVDGAADPLWRAAADRIIRELAASGVEFTTDDVWSRLDRTGTATHEPRALGALLKAAAQRGIVRATDRYRNSVRVECHARPVRVWVGAA